MKKYFIIDFDSTFIQVEALDELAKLALDTHPEKLERLSQIERITNACMSGKLSFNESLNARCKLFNAHKKDIDKLVSFLKQKISPSFERNIDFFQKYRSSILIISNGFKDFILPTIVDFDIPIENIYANTFKFDRSGNIIGFDQNNPLTRKQGKVILVKQLKLDGEIYVIGDGFSDYEIHKAGLTNKFYAFTENIERLEVTSKTKLISPNLDDFLYNNKLPRRFSYPKHRIKVLLLENIHEDAKAILEKEGYSVETIPTALNEEELIKAIKNISILGIRSKTQITDKVLKHANALMCIGAFCVGTNQINLKAAINKGCVIFNAPYSNTRSVVEMAIGNIIMLAREIIPKHIAIQKGKWQKSLGRSHEIRGKKIGIIGYGNIGSQLSILAEAMGMHVYYYDIIEKLALGNAIKCLSLKELLQTVDIVSLHVDGRKENYNFFDAEKLNQMKDNAMLLNLSRGNVIDISALVEALQTKKIASAAIDVFPEEPKNNHEPFTSTLLGLPNVILTPHIGGNTLEAQREIASYVPQQIIEYVNTGNTIGSINFPHVHLAFIPKSHRLLHVHKNMPGILEQIHSIYKKYNCNILGEHLQTDGEIGYVVTDIDKYYNSQVIEELKKIKNTIKFRVLF